MTPAPTINGGKKAKVFLTDDMRRKVAVEYFYARSQDKKSIAEKYNVSPTAISGWIRKGYVPRHAPPDFPERGLAPEKKLEENLEDLLWRVVIKAREAGEVTTAEARRLLELVR